jgi:hypothetical protein
MTDEGDGRRRMANVRCYAGASYPERPVAFEWKERWLEVDELIRQARTPGGLVFDVLAEDGRGYRLAWNAGTDEWVVEPASGNLSA